MSKMGDTALSVHGQLQKLSEYDAAALGAGDGMGYSGRVAVIGGGYGLTLTLEQFTALGGVPGKKGHVSPLIGREVVVTGVPKVKGEKGQVAQLAFGSVQTVFDVLEQRNLVGAPAAPVRRAAA